MQPQPVPYGVIPLSPWLEGLFHGPPASPQDGILKRSVKALREAGAEKQVAMLLARDPAAHTRLNDPYRFIHLLRALREAGAGEQVTALPERLAAAGYFQVLIELGDYGERFKLGREPDGSAATPWTWEDLE
ncbi:hypothetical protein [Streptomyces sp. NPDC090026]|uniref:hypothetical protein n=1 Tax=Streptomyces sp. NPDC090026 TaxID=3365923 RepID=UPI0037F440C5